MNTDMKQAYIDKMSAQLKELGAKTDVIKAQVAKGGANLRIDFHKEVEEWKKKESHFKTQLEAVQTATTDTLEDVKTKAQAAWQDLTSYVTTAYNKITDGSKSDGSRTDSSRSDDSRNTKDRDSRPLKDESMQSKEPAYARRTKETNINETI